MADWPPKKNAAFTLAFPIYDADGDPVTGAAGLDSEVSIDGGAFADCTNEATEITGGNGVYTLALTNSEMNGDIIAVVTKTSTSGAKTAVNVIYTVTRQLVDLAYPATSGRSIQVETDGMVHADLKEWLGTAPLALSSQRVQSHVGGFDADVITASAIAADAIGASELASDAVAEIADAVWDEAMSGHLTIGSYGHAMRGLALQDGSVVSDAGNSASTFKTDLTEATNDHYNGGIIVFTTGSEAGQVRMITDYDGTTKFITINPALTGTPASGDDFVVVGARAPVEPNSANNRLAIEADGMAHSDLREWLGTAPLALSSQRVQSHVGGFDANVITAAAIADGAIDAATFASGAINAAALAADAVAEIADGVWDEDIVAAHGAADTAGRAIRTLDAISDRTNNSDLNALLGVPDTPGIDLVDEIFVRQTADWETSAAVKSLGVAVMKAVHRIRDNAGTLEIYRSNGTTVHASQIITTNAANDPIDELTGAA